MDLGNNPIGLVDPLGATETSPLDPGSGTRYTNPSQRGGGVPGPSPGGGGFGNLFGEVGREIDRQLRRIGDAAMRSNALRQAGRAGGRVGGGGTRSSTRGVYAGGNTSARTLPQVPAVVRPGTGSGTTIGPETFAPNTAGKIESAVKSEPGDVETTIGIALGPLGWGHLFVRHVAAPAAYDLVDDVYIVATDIVYEQGWSVRGSRHMNGMGADGREQLDARLNVFTFGMGFVFTPELGAARMLSPETGTSLADETIEGTVALFDDAVRSAADINVVTHTPQSIPMGAQLLENVTVRGKYAFGLKNIVPEFAEEIGASHLMKDPNWRSSFIKIINNSESELHFTLEGIDEAPMQMILNPSRSGINWEMHMLYNSPAFEETVFYFGGRTYKGFEVFQIKP